MKAFMSAMAIVLFAAMVHAEDAYPKAEMLIEPAELAKGTFVILDARTQAKYEAGHVPGSIWIDHDQWAKDFNDEPMPEKWSRNIGTMGIAADTKVVVYDDAMNKDAARIWFILKYWGVKDVRLLHGGWVGWQSNRFPVDKERTLLRKVEFKAVAHDDKLATKDQLLKSITEGKLQIVDARSEKEHCGIEAMKNKKAGSMPGAKNLEWSDLLDKETQRFKSPAELKKLFDAAGIKLNEPTATHCQAGGRAAVMSFGMELMGAPAVGTYYRSWSEWGNAEDTPVVKPEPKK